MAKELPTAMWQGEFTICGVTLKVCVLDDGQRVIEAESFERLMAAMADGSFNAAPEDWAEFAKFVGSAKL